MSVGFAALPVLMILGVVTIFVLVAVSSRRGARRRQETMAAFAHSRGWSYEPHRPGLARRLGLARPADGTNVVEGVVDHRPFVAFDHVRYESDGDNGQRTIPVSVLAINLGLSVPQLEISRQGAISRFFTDLFGTDHLVGDKTFDDAVRIRTNSAAFASEVLTLPIKQLLLDRLHRTWRFAGEDLVTFTDGKHTPAELQETLEACRQILALIPPAVWARLEAGSGMHDAPVADAPVADAPVADAPPPAPPASASGTLEHSIGWDIDPITGKRTER